MVEFEEIKDEHYEDNDDGFEDEETGDEYSDVSSEADDDADISIEHETIYDRIVALKDIISASQRDVISRTLSKTFEFSKLATFVGGKTVYVMMSSILMVGIPLALSVEEERAYTEQERVFNAGQGMSEVRS